MITGMSVSDFYQLTGTNSGTLPTSSFLKHKIEFCIVVMVLPNL
jgi:hypothetical protein